MCIVLRRDGVADVRHEMMSALATMVLKMFDRDGDGKLDFQEFIIGISCLSNGARSDRAKRTHVRSSSDNNISSTTSSSP